MKKKLISAAVSAALIGGVGGLQTATAQQQQDLQWGDTIFGHTYSNRAGTFTIVSTITEGTGRKGDVVDTHWTYMFKEPDASALSRCQHVDDEGQQTPNDLSTYVLTPGVEISVFSDPSQAGQPTTRGRIPTNSEGMFAVSTREGEAFGFNDTQASEGSLHGEVIFLDVNTGILFFSYRMINHPLRTDEDGFNQTGYPYVETPFYDLNADPQLTRYMPEILAHPLDLDGAGTPFFDTSWFLVAPSFAMLRQNPDARDTQILQVAVHDEIGTPNLFYDRNENIISTDNRFAFNCFAEVTPAQLLGPAVDLVDSGFWAHLRPTRINNNTFFSACLRRSGDNAATPQSCNVGLLVYKLESLAQQFTLFTSENRFDF